MPKELLIPRSVSSGWIVFHVSGWAIPFMIFNGFLRLFILATSYVVFCLTMLVPGNSSYFLLILQTAVLLTAINLTMGYFLIRRVVTVATGDDQANKDRVRALLSRDFPNYKISEDGPSLIRATWSNDLSPVSREMLFLFYGDTIGINCNSMGRGNWRWMSLACFSYRRSHGVAGKLAALG